MSNGQDEQPFEGDELPDEGEATIDQGLDAADAILDRLRIYCSENNCSARVSMDIEVTGLPDARLKEKYIIGCQPIGRISESLFKDRIKDFKKIVDEEMEAAFKEDGLTDTTLARPADPVEDTRPADSDSPFFSLKDIEKL